MRGNVGNRGTAAGSARPRSLGTASPSRGIQKAAKGHSGSCSLPFDLGRDLARRPRLPPASRSHPPPPLTCAGSRQDGAPGAAGSARMRRRNSVLRSQLLARLPLAPNSPSRATEPVKAAALPSTRWAGRAAALPSARWEGRAGGCGRKWWSWEGRATGAGFCGFRRYSGPAEGGAVLHLPLRGLQVPNLRDRMWQLLED